MNSLAADNQRVKIPIFLLSSLLAVQPSAHVRECNLYSEELSIQRHHFVFGASPADRRQTGKAVCTAGDFDLCTAVSKFETANRGNGRIEATKRHGHSNGGKNKCEFFDFILPPRDIFLNILIGQSHSQSR